MKKKKIKVGVAGIGHLGNYHLQKYQKLENCEIVAVADVIMDRAQKAAEIYQCAAFSDYRDMLDKVDAVSIAVLTSDHYAVARDFLAAGVDVLIEKPICTTLAQADELIELAQKKKLVLQVGFVERFNPAIMALEKVIKKPLFIESHRLHPFFERGIDVDVILDLMIHDLDIMVKFVNSPVTGVEAVGVAILSDKIDIANARISFASGCIANITASRISGKTMQKIRFFGIEGYHSVDCQKREILSLGKGENNEAGQLQIIQNNIEVGSHDPLEEEIRSFINAVTNRSQPLISGEEARKSLALAIDILKKDKSCRGPVKMIPMVDLKRQYHNLKKEIDAAISDVLEQTRFILGPNVSALEEEVAAYHGLSYAAGVANGTDALLLALRACGIGAGDEVITTPFTFIATAEVIALLKATPVFVDICPDTYNLDCNQIAGKITSKTKAIIPVHLFGHPADMAPIMEIAQKHNLKVIEDCAQAFGAKYNGKKVGTIGDAGCFSFFPSKNLAGYGDGGMVITRSEDIAKQVKMLRNHGSSKRYYHQEIGYNSRLDEIQAAIIRVKLKKIDQFNAARCQNAAAYCAAITRKDIILPVVASDCEHVYHQFTIRAKNRDILADALQKKDIASAVYYPVPLHQQEVFLKFGDIPVQLPQSERCAQEVLSLPMFPELNQEEILLIADVINNAS